MEQACDKDRAGGKENDSQKQLIHKIDLPSTLAGLQLLVAIIGRNSYSKVRRSKHLQHGI